jgi:hypothetical protein
VQLARVSIDVFLALAWLTIGEEIMHGMSA